MVDYRVQVDDLLANWCIENDVEYSDMHDEAFVVKVGDEWKYVWYNEDCSVYDHLRSLKDILNYVQEVIVSRSIRGSKKKELDYFVKKHGHVTVCRKRINKISRQSIKMDKLKVVKDALFELGEGI